MEERSRSTIDIKRSASGQETTIAQVLITEGSTRVFSLMQSDYIQLNFALDSAIYFEIGDYVDDEIFGRFVVTEHQMPNYNTATGGYDYTLKLEAEHYIWKNKMFMLTTLDKNQSRIRKENDWCLTDVLAVHLQEVLYNIEVLGYSGYSFQIENTAEHAAEVKFLQYTNKDIISSLTLMANEWECEWWIKDKVIHFGKCEDSGSVLDFELGVSVESMTIQKNINNYLNKIFAYGSTQNIPYNYRKKLVFDVKDVTVQDGITLYGDTARPITEGMGLNTDSSSTIERVVSLAASEVVDIAGGTCRIDSDQFVISKACMLHGDLRVMATFTALARYTCRVTCQLLDSNGAVVMTLATYSNNGYAKEINEVLRIDAKVNEGTYTIHSEMAVSLAAASAGERLDLTMLGTVSYNMGGESKWFNLYLEEDETPYRVTANPLHQVHTMDYYGYFMFMDETPQGFGVGSKFYLDPINYADVPASYYSIDYDDPSSLAKLGEVRLELPESTGGYLITDPNLSRDQVVESVVIFNDVYPHAIQKVTQVTTEDKESTEEQQDGSKTTWAWTQYHLKASLADGNEFPFSKKYISDAQTLQIKFITKEDLEKAGYTASAGAEYRLAGMTFDVQYDEALKTYIIVRNENYGAKLPNDTLKPSVGDPFVLINWNVKAMEELGLIDIAERQLQAKAQDYLDAIEQGQFTFTCNLMSKFLFDMTVYLALYAQGYAFITSDGELFCVKNLHTQPFFADEHAVYTSDGERLYVEIGGESYMLPTEGNPVRVVHGALRETKRSRIIGYQFKLDKPYDTPQYTIGETQAYSRLAQIEKSLTKIQ